MNQFPTTVPIGQNPVFWNISYDGWVSTAYSANYTTCTQYCCNSQTCTTTNNSCSSLGLPGTVVSGGYTGNPGVGTNCSQGLTITPNLPFPCPCTTGNPGGCGYPQGVNVTEGLIPNSCVIGGNDPFFSGVCSVIFGYTNPGPDVITIPIGPFNNVTATSTNTIVSYTQITTFLVGTFPAAMNVTYTCPGGIGGAKWFLENFQVFTNY